MFKTTYKHLSLLAAEVAAEFIILIELAREDGVKLVMGQSKEVTLSSTSIVKRILSASSICDSNITQLPSRKGGNLLFLS